METYTAKINHFIIRPSAKINSFCKVFATKPNLEKEKILGKLFGLIEIKSKNQSAVQLTDFIIDQIKINYYQKENTADIEERFAKALHQTNLDLAQFLETNENKINLKGCNIIIALLKNKSLYLSNVGQLIALLIYYQSKNNYQIINIQSETDETENNEVNPLKIFSSTISGKINPLDFLFLGTADILNYLSLEKIKNLIISNPLSEISKKFKEELWSLTKKGLSAGLIIALEIVKSEALIPTQLKEFNFRAVANQDSMKQLMSTEKTTQKLLSPSILSGFKKYSEYFKNIFNNYSKRVKSFAFNKSRSLPQTTNYAEKMRAKKNSPIKVKSLKKIWSPFKSLIQMISQTIKNLLIKLPPNPLIKLSWQWPRLSKLTLILFIILAILLSQNIIKTNLKKRKEKDTQSFNQILTEITQKSDAGKASLIYQDERNARAMLIQAQELIKTLPKKYQNLPEIIKLKEEIKPELDKLRHEFIIAEPVLLANFKNLDSQMTPAPLALKIDEDFYTQNHRNQAIYKLNLTSRVIAALQMPGAENGNFYWGAVFSPEELLFLNDKQLLFSFDVVRNELTPTRLNLTPEAKIATVSVFANRLYLLDVANNQITRFRKTSAGFTEPNQWLDDQTVNLKNAVDFTVEGNIYLLNSNGEIIKLTKGQKANFASPIIDPPLKSPTKIKTEENSQYLYILDPPTKRIVVIDKTSQLIAQYSSPLFDDLKDFIVSENEAKIYVLAGSSVYGIPAKHLE